MVVHWHFRECYQHLEMMLKYFTLVGFVLIRNMKLLMKDFLREVTLEGGQSNVQRQGKISCFCSFYRPQWPLDRGLLRLAFAERIERSGDFSYL